MAERYAIELLGQLPLDIHIREQADSGKPTVIAEPDSANALLYRNIAKRIMAKLALQGQNESGKFPTIMIKND